MEFCRQEQWSGLPFPSSEDLPNPGLLYSRQIICVAGQTPKRFFVQAPKKSCNIQSGLPGGSVVNNPPAMQETWVQSLGWEDPLEKEMATHSSILAWKIPWTEEPGGLQSMGLHRVGHD